MVSSLGKWHPENSISRTKQAERTPRLNEFNSDDPSSKFEATFLPPSSHTHPIQCATFRSSFFWILECIPIHSPSKNNQLKAIHYYYSDLLLVFGSELSPSGSKLGLFRNDCIIKDTDFIQGLIYWWGHLYYGNLGKRPCWREDEAIFCPPPFLSASWHHKASNYFTPTT